MLAELHVLLHTYAQDRGEGERFGDFSIRQGWVQTTTSVNTATIKPMGTSTMVYGNQPFPYSSAWTACPS